MNKKFFSLLSMCILLIFANSCRKDELVDLPAFTYSQTNGVLPVTLSFMVSVPASSTATWDFGDGQTGTGSSISHTYAAQGQYVVSVTLTSPGQLTVKQTKMVNVFPYTRFTISQIVVTIPHSAYIHYSVYNSAGAGIFDASYPSFTSSGTSLSNNPVPPLVITDLVHSIRIEFWNFTSVISTVTILPSNYFQSTLPFPTIFTTTDVQGRTVTMTGSWY
jgi:PKD repeat protein